MRQTVYKCDECKKEIGEKKHITLQFGQYSGIAVPPLPKGAAPIPRNSDPLNSHFEMQGCWTVKDKLQGKFAHFCNAVCIGAYFRKLLKKY